MQVVDLGDDRMGETDGRALIRINDGMLQTERRCTLAHELVHMEMGHSGPCTPGEELAVAKEAARRLIPVAELASAVSFHGENWPAVADELWVDETTLRTRLDHLHPAERGYLKRRLAMKEETA